MAELHINRRVYDITERDVVLFNGAVWQLITQNYFSGWHSYYPKISKITCEKFVKKNILVMFKKEKEYLTESGQQMGLYYYKFDMEKLEEYLKQEYLNSSK